MRGRALIAIVALAVMLGVAAPSLASEAQPTLAELENEVYCPTCKSLLSLSNAPIAQRMRQFISEQIAAGATKSEIKAALVDQFGEAVLAAPLLRASTCSRGPAVRRHRARRRRHRLPRRPLDTRRPDRGPGPPGDPSANGRRALDPELERRLDEELARYDG